ncbi:hypothetical protein AMTR_s00235p00023410 [Amborella trichopoda]|uniref:Uncharacterized protein n=1 Tax=Amborella trichopoda TaxID=13333 RepID=W1NUU7_AMBTC|nr:hypothetical protein AMTR_s00235p00023410 [Amborella trichopoda]
MPPQEDGFEGASSLEALSSDNDVDEDMEGCDSEDEEEASSSEDSSSNNDADEGMEGSDSEDEEEASSSGLVPPSAVPLPPVRANNEAALYDCIS